MIYFLLAIMILTNAGETISYKNTKVTSGIDTLFGVSLWSLILSIPTVLFYLIFYGKGLFNGLTLLSSVFIFLGTLLALLSIVFWSKASKNMPMSVAEGVSEIYIAFLTIFSWLIYGGELSIIDIILLVIVILACFMLAFIENKKSKEGRYNYKLGFIFLALWIAVYTLRGLIPGSLAEGGMNGIAYNFLLNLLMMLSGTIVLLISKRPFKRTFVTVIKDKWLFIIGFCRAASHIALISLALSMNLGIVDGVSVFGLVIIMLYERLVMKEKLSILSYIVMLVIALATLLLAIL